MPLLTEEELTEALHQRIIGHRKQISELVKLVRGKMRTRLLRCTEQLDCPSGKGFDGSTSLRTYDKPPALLPFNSCLLLTN
ncbi:hypothetical protein [Crocosphaera watsonii]|nr:hypothetical protein [Crocosphaera watsonii]